MALLPAGLALGELLMELARIEQDQGGQLDRSGRRVNGPPIPLLDEERKQSAVVEMGVGQEHRIQAGRIERERNPVANGFIWAALEHAAIDQDPGARRG